MEKNLLGKNNQINFRFFILIIAFAGLLFTSFYSVIPLSHASSTTVTLYFDKSASNTGLCRTGTDNDLTPTNSIWSPPSVDALNAQTFFCGTYIGPTLSSLSITISIWIYCTGVSNSCGTGSGGIQGYLKDVTTGTLVTSFSLEKPASTGTANCALGATVFSFSPTASTGLTSGDLYEANFAQFQDNVNTCYNGVTDSNIAISGTPAISTTTTTLTSTTTLSPTTTTVTDTSTSTVTSTMTSLSTTTATSTTTSLVTDTSTVTSTTTSLSTSTVTSTTTSVSTTTVNSPHHSTITKLTCSPTSVALNVKTTCTAKVTDDSPGPTLPTGTVAFSSTGAGVFGSVSCSSSSTTKTLTCKATFDPTSIPSGGIDTISATYLGDSTHDQSLGTFKLKVT